jgi:hypothetical protein
MSDLIDETPEANSWVTGERLRLTGHSVFGDVQAGVIWTDNLAPDGEVIGGADPSRMIDEINGEGWPLYRGHDPGLPSGRSIAAKLFVSPSGKKFVAAILGFYVDNLKFSFDDLGVDSNPEALSPLVLDAIPNNCWLDISTDPREVDTRWVANILRDSPLRIVQRELSHNTGDWQNELIRVGLVYAALVWNPFVTKITQEAAKDVYDGIRQWLRNLWSELGSLKDPIVSLESHQDGCNISFLIRGKEVKSCYEAHDALPIAAAQAVILIRSMKSHNADPSEIIYEFDPQNVRWFPSYATLKDGRFVSDRNILIALEQHPVGLSIGIQRNKKKLPKPK